MNMSSRYPRMALSQSKRALEAKCNRIVPPRCCMANFASSYSRYSVSPWSDLLMPLAQQYFRWSYGLVYPALSGKDNHADSAPGLGALHCYSYWQSQFPDQLHRIISDNFNVICNQNVLPGEYLLQGKQKYGKQNATMSASVALRLPKGAFPTCNVNQQLDIDMFL